MNLAQLRAFVSVVDAGSFSSASQALGLTQSGVSHAVASMERELGAHVVLRSPRGVMLTATGDAIIGHARSVVEIVDRIREEAAAVRGRFQGRLRVAAPPSAGPLLAPVVGTFQRRFPDVDVVLLEGTDAEVADWLDGGLAELGVCTGGGDPLEGVLLSEDRMVAVVDRGHPLAGEASVMLADLTDDPFLLSDGGCEPLLEGMFRTAGLALRPARRVRDMATLLALVREQVGVTVVPELALTGVRGVVGIAVEPATVRRLHLIVAPTGNLGPLGRSFLDIAESARQGLPLDPFR